MEGVSKEASYVTLVACHLGLDTQRMPLDFAGHLKSSPSIVGTLNATEISQRCASSLIWLRCDTVQPPSNDGDSSIPPSSPEPHGPIISFEALCLSPAMTFIRAVEYMWFADIVVCFCIVLDDGAAHKICTEILPGVRANGGAQLVIVCQTVKCSFGTETPDVLIILAPPDERFFQVALKELFFLSVLPQHRRRIVQMATSIAMRNEKDKLGNDAPPPPAASFPPMRMLCFQHFDTIRATHYRIVSGVLKLGDAICTACAPQRTVDVVLSMRSFPANMPISFATPGMHVGVQTKRDLETNAATSIYKSLRSHHWIAGEALLRSFPCTAIYVTVRILISEHTQSPDFPVKAAVHVLGYGGASMARVIWRDMRKESLFLGLLFDIANNSVCVGIDPSKYVNLETEHREDPAAMSSVEVSAAPGSRLPGSLRQCGSSKPRQRNLGSLILYQSDGSNRMLYQGRVINGFQHWELHKRITVFEQALRAGSTDETDREQVFLRSQISSVLDGTHAMFGQMSTSQASMDHYIRTLSFELLRDVGDLNPLFAPVTRRMKSSAGSKFLSLLSMLTLFPALHSKGLLSCVSIDLSTAHLLIDAKASSGNDAKKIVVEHVSRSCFSDASFESMSKWIETQIKSSNADVRKMLFECILVSGQAVPILRLLTSNPRFLINLDSVKLLVNSDLTPPFVVFSASASCASLGDRHVSALLGDFSPLLRAFVNKWTAMSGLPKNLSMRGMVVRYAFLHACNAKPLPFPLHLVKRIVSWTI